MMASSYSVKKRGKVYYVYRRINSKRWLVGKSLRTIEQREAYLSLW